MCRFFLLGELARGESVTNGATPSGSGKGALQLSSSFHVLSEKLHKDFVDLQFCGVSIAKRNMVKSFMN